MNAPRCTREWWQISADYTERGNFPHGIGAIDRKHGNIEVQARNDSTYFYNKKTFRIVLLAICNAKYEFSLVDIGSAGRQSDGRIFNNSLLGISIENK